MAQILNSLLGHFARPKQVIVVREDSFVYLDAKTANILYAIAEAVLGPDFMKKSPTFMEIVDDYLNFQRRSQREAFMQALLLIENALFNLTVGRRLQGFSHMSIAERRALLDRLRASEKQFLRNLYAAFVNISASTYYSQEATWPDIQYEGVSVDHPELLQIPRWRPKDSRPVET